MELRGPFLLVFLTTINFLIYTDRGAVASLISHLKADLSVSDSYIGFAGSAFMLGYMVSSPLFAYALQYASLNSLISIGTAIWLSATALTSLSTSYSLLLTSRILTGAGEAAFCPLVPALILKTAPTSRKSLYLGVFYSMITVGQAFGYLYGEFIVSVTGSWRWAFCIECTV